MVRMRFWLRCYFKTRRFRRSLCVHVGISQFFGPLQLRINGMATVSNKLVQFRDCLLLRNNAITRDDLWIRDGKILNPEPLFYVNRECADVQIDCDGAIIAPGFIDVQINGGFGVDFSCETNDVAAGIQKVAKGILAHGVTSFCPTIVTSPKHIYAKVLPKIRPTVGGTDGAGVLGVHVEGPFISKEKKGAHQTQHIRSFETGFQDVLDIYGSIDNVRMITLAPELRLANEVIGKLVQSDITVSLGHSMGNLADGERAVQCGANFITHLFNAMLPFHHRDPGLVGLLTSNALPPERTMFYGIIADGIHTHPAALRIAHRTHPKGLVLVTDAISPMGLAEGRHLLGQQVVDIVGSRALVAGTQTLCGSIASMDACVRHFMDVTQCSVVEALESASLHPAQALGIIDRKGTLDYGTDADFIVLDSSLNVLSTYIAGERVWSDDGPESAIR